MTSVTAPNITLGATDSASIAAPTVVIQSNQGQIRATSGLGSTFTSRDSISLTSDFGDVLVDASQAVVFDSELFTVIGASNQYPVSLNGGELFDVQAAYDFWLRSGTTFVGKVQQDTQIFSDNGEVVVEASTAMSVSSSAELKFVSQVRRQTHLVLMP
jgi:hypothetical protein